MTTDGPTSKAVLRARLLAARRELGASARAAAAAQVTRDLLALPELVPARCIAAYLSFGTEPDTTAALSAWNSLGIRVLVPLLAPDRDLDWAIYVGSPHSSPSRVDLWTPESDRLGVEAVAEADAVVVPALAVGADGTRLGRGGGSYDRALARVPAGRPVIALLYAGELLPDVPAEAHDRRVTTAVLPTGVHRFGSGS